MCQRMSTSIYQRKMFQGLFAVPGKMTNTLRIYFNNGKFIRSSMIDILQK